MGLVFILAWLVYLAILGPKRPGGGRLAPPRLERALIAHQADFSWKLRDLNDQPVDLSKFRGRALFLNIWATWCPPCVEEMPSIANLADNARLKNVAFVCVSTDESIDQVRAFLRDKHWSMTILRASEVPEVFATSGIPATFVIAPSGRIVTSELGAAQWDDPTVVDYLEELSKKSVTPKKSGESDD